MASVAAALALDYLVNVVVMPGATPYTPLGTLVVALLVSGPTWYFVIGQQHALERARDAIAESLTAQRAAETENRAKSEFLAIMSHELRTPLNAIIGYGEMLGETAAEDGRASDEKDSRRIVASAGRLLAMIDEILTYAQLDSGRIMLQTAPCDMRTLIRDAVAPHRDAIAAAGNRLDMRVAKSLAVIGADSMRLKQCVSALVSNAAAFTRDGAVSVVAREEAGRDRRWLVCDVRDSGVGIAPERIDHVFEPFTQGDSTETRTHGGIGLGLATTRRLARLMGGDVTVQSAPGKGSTFSLRVPIEAA